ANGIRKFKMLNLSTRERNRHLNLAAKWRNLMPFGTFSIPHVSPLLLQSLTGSSSLVAVVGRADPRSLWCGPANTRPRATRPQQGRTPGPLYLLLAPPASSPPC